MKYLRLLLAILFLTTASSAVFAEHDHGSKDDKECSMHSDGKSGGKCDKCGEKEDSYACPLTDKLMKKAHFFLDNAKEIGFSDEQVKQIKAIKVAAKRAAIQENAAMEVFMLDLNSKLSEEKLDVEGLNKMIDESGAGMTQGAKEKVKAYAALRAVPSAEQMAKAKELWKKK